MNSDGSLRGGPGVHTFFLSLLFSIAISEGGRRVWHEYGSNQNT